ncbi:histidine phosphatase family protein [Cognaticolwellia beringensis]|uniref:Histidine phosphatase family protein n=1 Tax=Cognaticolwellia beringensis TaxID=1967665 RepID=A0A222GAH5_9GAMM|nr:histidine phosphatase family protein [Cognaticolwellia beringensis]ASP48791.1 histidine phosphatase family protein [Cognaticolwellia beringensis]
MTTNLYLARHGETQWNKVQRFQGQLDSELTETGKQQSKALAMHLADQEINLIVSSSLGRAVSSAKLCQQQLNAPLCISDKLIERDLGHWQGQYVDDIKSDKSYHEILHQFTALPPEDGESAVNCASRIYQALETLAKNNINKNLLVIFHGEALRCFLAKLGHSATGNAYQLFKNGCLFPLSYQHDNQRFQLLG